MINQQDEEVPGLLLRAENSHRKERMEGILLDGLEYCVASATTIVDCKFAVVLSVLLSRWERMNERVQIRARDDSLGYHPATCAAFKPNLAQATSNKSIQPEKCPQGI